MSNFESIAQLESEAQSEISEASTVSQLKEIEIRFLGRNGALTALLREVGTLPADQKPAFGKQVNEAKVRLQSTIDEKLQQLAKAENVSKATAESLDITMPGRNFASGLPHVLSQTIDRIRNSLIGLGFEYVETPELEETKYNFLSLNYPPDHPAMDDQDTFYIDDNRLLRTQCTAFQARIFETTKPPFRKFTIGRCFRNEAVDRTHGHTFFQVDVFMVDKGVSMAHLKGTLSLFARAMFGENIHVRFRPDFFPFVEPGVDYSITNPFKKSGGADWLELGGAGLVHPNILESFGIDTDEYSGFAFGLGVERIAMTQFGIDDLRLFFDNDLRFLEQFPA